MPKLYPGYRDEIQKKIIGEAFALFLEKGFEKTTMDDVASRLGVTKPAIYRYFRSKEELFGAAVGVTLMAEFRESFAGSFAGDDLEAGADLFFDALLALSRRYSAIAMDVMLLTGRNESFREEVPGLQLEGHEMVREFFEEQKRRGKIRTEISGKDLALLCIIIAKGLIGSVMAGMDPAEAKRAWISGFGTLTGIPTRRRR